MFVVRFMRSRGLQCCSGFHENYKISISALRRDRRARFQTCGSTLFFFPSIPFDFLVERNALVKSPKAGDQDVDQPQDPIVGNAEPREPQEQLAEGLEPQDQLIDRLERQDQVQVDEKLKAQDQLVERLESEQLVERVEPQDQLDDRLERQDQDQADEKLKPQDQLVERLESEPPVGGVELQGVLPVTADIPIQLNEGKNGELDEHSQKHHSVPQISGHVLDDDSSDPPDH